MSTHNLLRALARTVCGGMLLLVSWPALAGSTWTVSGTLSGTYPVSAAATFVTSGSLMTLTLENTSPLSTIYPAQVLTSFYFDMLTDGTSRVGLTCTSGSGYVAKIVGGGTAAQPYTYVPPSTTGTGPSYTPNLSSPLVLQLSDILVKGTGDNSWLFKSGFDVSQMPFSYYGIGTVGNSGTVNGFTPNNFPAPYVDGIDFGIFAGDASDPRGNLVSGPAAFPYLVSGSATFTFVADQDIDNYVFRDPYVFGFGTQPDQAITIVPEPARLGLLATVVVLAGGLVRGRHRRGRP